MLSFLREIFLFIVGALALAGGFLVPETRWSALLGIFAAIAFALAVKRQTSMVMGFFVGGVVLHAIGFYWLPGTLELFGGFPFVVSFLWFLVFCCLSSLQFVVCGLLCKKIFSILGTSNLVFKSLVLPVCWFLCDWYFPKLFPWTLAHTQICFTPFSGLAEYLPVQFLSAVLLFWASFLAYYFGQPKQRWEVIVAGSLVICFVSLLYFQDKKNRELSSQLALLPKVRVALVQGNLGTQQKRDVTQFTSNIERYRELTSQAIRDGAELVLWPETIGSQWLREDIENVKGAQFDPLGEERVPLLYGTLSIRKRSQEEINEILGQALTEIPEGYQKSISYHLFNSAFGIDVDGRVLGKYHKKILMPFGEYLPFERWFPFLRLLSPQTGSFSAGTTGKVIEFQVADRNIRIQALICYEDLVPSLVDSVEQDRIDLLVNLTNDAWYGDTVAPHQHNLLAVWRAIETRKYLLRVTNTGLTSVVDPLGRTLSRLPTFVSDVLIADIPIANRAE